MNNTHPILRPLITLIIAFTSIHSAFATVNITPKPAKVTELSGHFIINKQTKIIYNTNAFKPFIEVIEHEIKLRSIPVLVSHVEKTPSKRDNVIELELVDGMEEDAYVLEVGAKKIACRASSEGGLFYGMQSLMQLVGVENGKATVNCVKIEDKPLMAWRGFMLDESRHFFGKEVVKQYLDMLARLKMNRFHWHLTDEQAWRIEIKRYPLLTLMGSSGSWSDSQAPSRFYTQDDIREIVAYAQQRNIMLIPEIDMPGHAASAAKCYPEISAGGTGRWKHFTFHPAREATYEFISNVLSEVAELFPSPYIHIGGDEVHFGNQSWFTDPEIQNFIKANYLSSEVGMEHYFVRRVCEIVHSKGKKMIGWDEIINTGVTPNKTVVMWWRHNKPEELANALNKGFQVILTPRVPCYFDFVQHESHQIGRRWDGKYGDSPTVYDFPGSIESIISQHKDQILGLQASLWTERIKDKKRLDYMLFPRLFAMAEDGWTTPENKNFADFEQRIKPLIQLLDKLGIGYFNPFTPESTPEPWGPDKIDAAAEG